MQPRTELLLAGSGLALLAAAVAVLAGGPGPGSFTEKRPTTYSSEPNGASALAEALTELGIRVERLRVTPPPRRSDSPEPAALAILEPANPPSPSEVAELVREASSDPGLVLVGPATRSMMRCFGFDTTRLADSVAAFPPGAPEGARAPRIRIALRRIAHRTIVDSSRLGDAVATRCDVPELATVETLLVTARGEAAAVRFRTARRGREVTLAGDVNLVRNRSLRETDAGPAVLLWFVGRFGTVWFDEYHQGFTTGGSLVRATLEWSLDSPWGWLGWQLAVAGVIALLVSAVRFGPVLPVAGRKRRSSVEHVRALAAALRAAGGHAVAVGLIVQGLRRRLAPSRTAGRGRWDAWLGELAAGSRSQRAREKAAKLGRLATGEPGEAQVLEATHLVEDLWTELRS